MPARGLVWVTGGDGCGLSGAPAGPRARAPLRRRRRRSRSGTSARTPRSSGSDHAPRTGRHGRHRALVWAIDTRHAPHVLVPSGVPARVRLGGADDDPRGSRAVLRPERRHAAARRRVGWLARVRACRLYAYRLPAEAFRRTTWRLLGGGRAGGRGRARRDRRPPRRHAGAGIELRVTPSVWPFWRRVAVHPRVQRVPPAQRAPHPDRRRA